MKRHKILVLRYRFIGDTILTVPFLRNLRKNYPDSQIDMLIAPVSGEVIEDCPYVDNFIYFDTTKKHRYENLNQEKKNFWYYVNLLRKEKYDKAYVLKRSFSSAALAFFAGIKERIGFDTEYRGFMLTKKVKYIENKHEIDCFLDVLKTDNLKVEDNYLENWVDEKILQAVKNKAPQDKKFVLVHATSGNRKKEWSEENFAQIVKFLSNEKDVVPIFLGTKNDSEKYEKIMSFIKNPLKNQPINYCGEFDLKQSLAFTSLASLIVGCDSGNLHMAASVKIPVVGIYGPMNWVKWCAAGDNNKILHSNLPCAPCGLKTKCKNNYKCLKEITVDDVKKAINEIL